MFVESEPRLANEMLVGAALGIAPASCRRPTRRSGVITRDHLVERLLDAAEAPLVVISAPAGYGKTTTLALWDDADERSFVWVHVDALDDDPVHLLQHVGLSLDEQQALAPTTARILAGRGRPVDTDLLPAVGSEFRRRRPFVLVLDDVHAVKSASTLRVVDGLAATLPPDSQLVLSGRAVPALPLARPTMNGQVFQLSVADLSMSAEEADRVLKSSGAHVEQSVLTRLFEQTEGWPGGLHLAALATQRRGSRPRAAEGISGSDRAVADYLIEEVLDGLDPQMVDFLERSAVLDRMSAPLLDRLLETDMSARWLEEIERSGNLFLVPLDEERQWFRFHHLFGEMLRGRLHTLDPEGAMQLERRASRLLDEHHDIDGAIRHAIAGSEPERAADLILQHAFDFAFSGRVARLGLWLELLGRDAIDESATAALASMWYGVATGDAELLARSLASTERLPAEAPLADGSPSVEVATAMVRVIVAAWGLQGVLRDTEYVRAAGRTHNPWWGLATAVQGTVYSMLGEFEIARHRLVEGMASVSAPVFEAGGLAHLALLDLHAGDVGAADRHAARGLAIAERHHLEAIVPAVVVFAVGSLVAARQGREAEARQHVTASRRILARLGDLSPRTALLCYLLVAQSAMAVGDLQLARSLATEARRARRSETEATFLNTQLDELSSQLEHGSTGGTLEIAPLTPAELHVLAYLPTHLSQQEIAETLFISRNTAKSHSVAIYRKLGVGSRSEAVQAAQRLGLLER